MNHKLLECSIRRNRIRSAIAAVLLIPAAGISAKEPLEVFELESITTKSGVFELPDRELWQYAQIEGFEILSNARPSTANNLLKDFQEFREALELIWPIQVQPLATSTIILCGKDNRFDELIPLESKEQNGVFSHFFRDRESSTIIIDLEDINYQAILQGQPVELEADYERELYREYARFLFTQTDPQLPPWLLEANIQTAIDLRIDRRLIIFGDPDLERGIPDPLDPVKNGSFPTVGEALKAELGIKTATLDDDVFADIPLSVLGNAAEELGKVPLRLAVKYWTQDPVFNVALTNRDLIPLDKMFTLPAEQYAEINPLVDYYWAKQAYAFVHYCKFNAKGKHKVAFDTFVSKISKEPLTEKLFEECFGLSYKKMLRRLGSYVEYPHHNPLHIKLKEGEEIVAENIVFRNATQSEIGRIKGDAQYLAGYKEEALLTYKIAFAYEKNDAELLSSLGNALVYRGSKEEGKELLEIAAILKTKRPSAWTNLARAKLDEAKEHPLEGRKLSTDQMAEILLPLLQARTLRPSTPQTYTIMAEAWEHSSIPPNMLQIELLSEGVLSFPSESELALRTAIFYAQISDFEHATMAARIGLSHSKSKEIRKKIEDFLATLPPNPPAA